MVLEISRYTVCSTGATNCVARNFVKPSVSLLSANIIAKSILLDGKSNLSYLLSISCIYA